MEVSFILAGWLATVEKWERFSEAWQECLAKPPRLEYFKGSELGTMLYQNSNADREAKKVSLAKIISGHGLRGYIATVPHQLLNRKPEKLKKLMGTKIYDWAFIALIPTVVIDHLERGERSRIDFIFDGCTELRSCIASYERQRNEWPPSMQAVSGTVIPGDDRELAGLQAADLLAGEHSTYLKERRKSLAYSQFDGLSMTCFGAYPPKALDRFLSYAREVYERAEFVKWMTIILKEHGLTMTDIGNAVRNGGWSSMYEAAKFNSAMDAILRADPAKVKAEVDAEIRANVEERKARGERKRGRKPSPRRSTSGAGRASGGKD